MSFQNKIKLIWKNIKTVFFHIEQKVPYIPDFSDAWTILKILLVSFSISVIYSFSQLQHASDFYQYFLPNLQMFAPYVIFQLLLLILASKIILKQTPFIAILIITILNLICVYVIHSIISKTLLGFFSDIDTTLAKFFVSFGILLFFLMYFDWREKNIDPANTLAKLIFLQSKMRPHFLFNTLNSVISLMKKEPETAKKMLLNLSELLRASLKDENISMYPIAEEINLCEKYLEIEKIRLGNRLSVLWDIDNNILTYHVPRLTIQPLIENSILHGIQNLENGGIIEIKIKNYKTEKISIEIINPVNNKTVFNNNNNNNISLKNIKERLKIYFGGDIKFNISEIDNKFRVYVIIPQKIH